MRSRTKKILRWAIPILLLIAAALGYYIYQEYNRKIPDTSSLKVDQSITDKELISAFEANDSLAGTRFMDKVILVSGTVKEMQKESSGMVTVVLGDEGSNSAVRCSVDSLHSPDLASVSIGNAVIMKGVCTGFNRDELLGSDVVLVRCVISNKN